MTILVLPLNNPQIFLRIFRICETKSVDGARKKKKRELNILPKSYRFYGPTLRQLSVDRGRVGGREGVP